MKDGPITRSRYALAWVVLGVALAHPGQCSGQAGVDEVVERQLRSVLQPLDHEDVAVRCDSLKRYFGDTQLCVGYRVPPFGQGAEDARPIRAGVAERQGRYVVVLGIEELPAAWVLAGSPLVTDSVELVDAILGMVNRLGILTEEELYGEGERMSDWLDTMAVERTSAVLRATEPYSRQIDGAREVVFYGAAHSGVFEYRVTSRLRDGASLEGEKRLLSRYKFQM